MAGMEFRGSCFTSVPFSPLLCPPPCPGAWSSSLGHSLRMNHPHRHVQQEDGKKHVRMFPVAVSGWPWGSDRRARVIPIIVNAFPQSPKEKPTP